MPELSDKQLRQRLPTKVHALPSRRPVPARGLPGYAELHCLSNFSFQRGASMPEELVRACLPAGLPGTRHHRRMLGGRRGARPCRPARASRGLGRARTRTSRRAPIAAQPRVSPVVRQRVCVRALQAGRHRSRPGGMGKSLRVHHHRANHGPQGGLQRELGTQRPGLAASMRSLAGSAAGAGRRNRPRDTERGPG